MTDFISGLVLLIITGLGFVTYKHPNIAKKILIVIGCAVSLIYISLSSYKVGQFSTLQEIDNTLLNNNPDSLSLSTNSTLDKTTKNIISSRIKTVSDKLTSFNTTSSYLFFFIFLALLVFWFLAGIFSRSSISGNEKQ